ncbi:ribose 5-phosphate isomerase A [Candidatus Thorarchaeota archaeon]|nr:MAG: ribose 5-phosphate isomerase A [Candidatus Thorarchaeota archaeon]
MMSKAKQEAAMSALNVVPDSGAIGLGSGSTVAIFAKELGKKIGQGQVDIKVVPSSYQAYQLAIRHSIPLTNLDLNPLLSITVDGADEVDKNLNLTKGGGGALFQEKIVASASDELHIIVDESKLVDNLSTKLPIPIEVLPFSLGVVKRKIEAMSIQVKVREAKRKMGPVITDNGNFILDLKFAKPIEEPGEIATQLKMIPGVIETGLFMGMTTQVHVGTETQSYILE